MKKQTIIVTLFGFLFSALFSLNSFSQENQITPYAGETSTTNTKVTNPEELLNQTVNTPADLDKLWKAYFNTTDPRYVLKILTTYQTIANDKRVNLEDLIYVASLSKLKPDQHDERLTTILQHYKDQAFLEQFLIGASALWSLGANANQHANIQQIIQHYINSSTDKTITASLSKMMFRSSFARVSLDPNLIFFTTNEPDYVNKYLTPFSPDKMYSGLKNEFTSEEKPYMVFAFPLGASEKLHLDITVKQPNGDIVMQNQFDFTGKDIQPHMAAIDTKLVPLATTKPLTPGIYHVTVSINKNNKTSKELKYSFLVD